MLESNIIELGKVGITVDKKPWSASSFYERLTMVHHIESGNTYVSVEDNINRDPSTDDGSNWILASSNGMSIYELMVARGKYSGTEEQFLADYAKAVSDANAAAATAATATTAALAAANEANEAKAQAASATQLCETATANANAATTAATTAAADAASIKTALDNFIAQGGGATDAQVIKNTGDISELALKVDGEKTVIVEGAYIADKLIVQKSDLEGLEYVYFKVGNVVADSSGQNPVIRILRDNSARTDILIESNKTYKIAVPADMVRMVYHYTAGSTEASVYSLTKGIVESIGDTDDIDEEIKGQNIVDSLNKLNDKSNKKLTPSNFKDEYTEDSKSANLFDFANMSEVGKRVNNDGSITIDNAYALFDVPVEGGKKYKFYLQIDGSLVGNVVKNCAFHDADGNVLATFSSNNAWREAPSGAVRFVASVTKEVYDTIDDAMLLSVGADDTPTDPTEFIPYYVGKLFSPKAVLGLDEFMKTAKPVDNIPNYWMAYLDKKIEQIRSHIDNIGDSSVSFIQFTDWHYNLNVKGTAPLLKYVADRLGIRHIINTGDNSSRLTNEDKTLHYKHFDEINDMFSSLMDRMIITQGNHDALISVPDGEGKTNTWLTKNEIYSRYYSPYYAKINNAIVAEGGLYYYVDDPIGKIRYISLNCFDVPDDTYNRGKAFAYSKKQIDWLADVALNVDDGWHIVLFSHASSHNVAGGNRPAAGTLVSKILLAFINRTSITIGYDVYSDAGSLYSEVDPNDHNYDIPSRNYNFTNAKGNIVFYTSGHCHHDESKTIHFNNPVMLMQHTMALDGIDEHQGTPEHPEIIIKTEGTTTEHAFDVYVVNKNTGYVRCTRIGAGDTDADWEFNCNNPAL